MIYQGICRSQDKKSLNVIIKILTLIFMDFQRQKPISYYY